MAEPLDIVAIVPALNEAPTIAGVISVLKSSGYFSEIIVVDDGSQDETAKNAESAGARVFVRKQNGGKGAALRFGIEQTHAPLFFFCDADLLGLTRDHIRLLVTPVLSGELAMCVGMRDRGRFWTWMAFRLPWIGGERALRREVIQAIPQTAFSGFRAELMMNACCRAFGLPMGARFLRGLTMRKKMQKVGFWKGLKGYLSMFFQMVDAWWLGMSAKRKGKF
ncbi:MAG: glycosyltransferase family 2 protein [bacterium]|nr:glycosyltransferase family 2 protein [bacterium]